jgi:S1-C subfamily serine protease
MKDIRLNRRATRAGVAILSATLLAGGYTWHSYAADATATAPAPQAAPASPSSSIASRIPASGRDSYADVVKVVAPAVVTVRVQGKAQASPAQFQGDDFFRRFFGDEYGGAAPRVPRSFRGLGSGVVISNDGYIVTNNHVVDDASDIQVELSDGRTLSAKVVGTDKATDLALIKVNAAGLRALTLGD